MKAMIYKTLSTVVDDFFAYDICIMFLWLGSSPRVSVASASRCHFCTV